MTFLPYATAAFALASTAPLAAQFEPEPITFEDIALPPDRGFENGATLRANGEFNAGGTLTFPYAFSEFDGSLFWSEWAISNRTDTVTGNFENEHSVYAGAGHNGSAQFAVAFGDTRINTNAVDVDQAITELYVANTTYAARVMQEGNQFSKKFGGVSGDDPDFFSVTFRGYRGAEPSADSVTVFLADYRFADNSRDYVLRDWLAVDLSVLGNVSHVTLRFDGSDVGDLGLNTPKYVAIDDVATRIDESSSLAAHRAAPAPRVFPSVAKEELRVDIGGPAEYAVFDLLGREAAAGTTAGHIDVARLPPGTYAVRLRDGEGAWTSAALFTRAE